MHKLLTLATTLATAPSPPPKTSTPDAFDRPTAAVVVGIEGLAVRGVAVADRAALRAELVAKQLAGEPVELTIDATTFVQRPTPNRNFVRFKRGTLRAFARSFVGVPFLMNHDQADVGARIGTVVASSASKDDAGDVRFTMSIRVTRADAAIMVLDGLIDRFSIGWSRTGPVMCTLDGKPLFGEGCCSHWPGDVVDGKVCEAEFTSAEGVEVSAVNVPAVVGTSIDDYRAALAAKRTDKPQIKETAIMDISLLKTILGLPETATEADVKAALAANAAARDQLAQTEARLLQRTVDDAIASARADGRLEIVRDASGNVVASPFEIQLRRVAETDQAMFSALLAAAPKRIPAQQGREPAPPTPTIPTGATAVPGTVDGLRASYKANPHVATAILQMGMTEAELEKFGPHNRLGLAENVPVPPHLLTVFRSRYIGQGQQG